jgi:hypothetical protein
MSQVLTDLLAEVENLNSLDELFILQERVNTRIRNIAVPNGNHKGNGHTSAQVTPESSEETVVNRLVIPGVYYRTKEEIEAFSASLKAMLPPEEQKNFGNRDFSHLVFEGKSTSELLIEDREDRF